MALLKSNFDTALLCLTILLCAAWLTSAELAAGCPNDACAGPTQGCQSNPVMEVPWQYMGCVGGGGCSGDRPCCCGYICWWKDEAGYCFNDDVNQCEEVTQCSV